MFKIQYFLILLSLTFFTACMERGDAKFSTTDNNISGFVAKGTVLNGTIIAYKDDGITPLTEKGTILSDSTYNLKKLDTTYTGNVKVEAFITAYVDEKLNEEINTSLKLNAFSTIDNEDMEKGHIVNVTAVTELSYRLLGGDDSDLSVLQTSDIEEQNRLVSIIVGAGDYDPTKEPINILVNGNLQKEDTPANRYGAVLASVSSASDIEGINDIQNNATKVIKAIDKLLINIKKADLEAVEKIIEDEMLEANVSIGPDNNTSDFIGDDVLLGGTSTTAIQEVYAKFYASSVSITGHLINESNASRNAQGNAGYLEVTNVTGSVYMYVENGLIAYDGSTEYKPSLKLLEGSDTQKILVKYIAAPTLSTSTIVKIYAKDKEFTSEVNTTASDLTDIISFADTNGTVPTSLTKEMFIDAGLEVGTVDEDENGEILFSVSNFIKESNASSVNSTQKLQSIADLFNYANNNGDVQNNDIPSIEDYQNLGFENEVNTQEKVNLVNSIINGLEVSVLTPIKLKEIINIASEIAAVSVGTKTLPLDTNTNPTVQNLVDIGLIDSENITKYRDSLLKAIQDYGTKYYTVPTLGQIQAMLDNIKNTKNTQLLSEIGSGTTTNVNAANLNAIEGIAGAQQSNNQAYKDYITANPSLFSNPATTTEVQVMIDNVNAAHVGVNLVASYDKGVSNKDNITNLISVNFDINVTEIVNGSNIKIFRNATQVASFIKSSDIQTITSITLEVGDNNMSVKLNDGQDTKLLTVKVDTAKPTIFIDATLEGNNKVSDDEKADVNISGTTIGVEDNQIVSIDVNGTKATATVTSNAWSVEMNLSSLSDGILTITADVSDSAGNTADTNTSTQLSKDIAKPTVSTPTFTSAAKTYVAGDDINVTYTFSENVIVTGTPQTIIKVGANNRTASYVDGNGTTTLVFKYTVIAGDEDTDGVEVEANKLTLNGGTIKDSATNNATLTHTALTADNTRKVTSADVTKSTVTVTSSSVIADNTTTTLITLQAKNSVGTNMTRGGEKVVFDQNGSATISSVTDVGGGTGIYTSTIKNATLETVEINATINGVAVTTPRPTVTFTEDANVSKSTVDVNQTTIDADGTSQVAIILQAKNSADANISTGGETIFFDQNGSATISGVSDNSNGTYTATITNTTMETVEINATIGGIAVTDTASITFDFPANITIDDANITSFIVSIYDNTYSPIVDIQGDINMTATPNGKAISIPYTVSTSTTTLPAYSKTFTIPISSTEDNESGIVATFAWAEQNLAVGTGVFTAYITITDGNITDSTFNAKKLDIDDNQSGLVAATFAYPTNNNSSVGTLTLEITPGIPDRMFGIADNDGNTTSHMFLYLPVTNPTTGKTWLNNNLGATYANINSPDFDPTQQATASNDYKAYGSLFQWGRKADGHELINWTDGSEGTGVHGTTDTNSNDPSTAKFIKENSSPYDWRINPNNTLWASESSTNNVCPQGYRLPLNPDGLVNENNEWNVESNTWNSVNGAGAFGGLLKLTRPGYRDNWSGSIYKETMQGYYWTGGRFRSQNVYYLYFRDISLNSNRDNGRALGYSVRCIKD